MCFFDDGVHLVLRELRGVDGIGEREHAARGHRFDDVGAELDLVAHGGAAFVGAVADSIDRSALGDADRGWNGVGVAMSAGGTDRMNSHEHARSGDVAGGDGVAQADVDVVARAEVAHRGHSGVDGLARVGRGQQRLLRRMPHQTFEVLAVVVLTRLEAEMSVGVDESRQQGHIAEIDHLGSRGNGTADRLDARSFDDDDGVRHDRVGRAIEETRRFQCHDLRRHDLLRENRQREKKRESDACAFHGRKVSTTRFSAHSPRRLREWPPSACD
jgi:hypothetical protein